MLASVEAPKNMVCRKGIWQVRVKIDGREKWRTTGHTTLAMAERRAGEILVSLRSDRDWKRAPTVPTFGEWVATYLETHASPSLAKRPQQLGRAVKQWRYKPLDTIRPTDVKSFLRELGKDWASSTVGLQHRLLTGVFNRAVDDGILLKNPITAVERPETAVRNRVLTREEEQDLRDRLPSEEKRRWLTFMLGTGLRLGEACAMRSDWVEGDHLAIPAEVTKTKTARVIPIFPHVRDALVGQLAHRGGCSAVWPNEGTYVRKWLKHYSQAAGVDHVWPHALRHTFGTRYLQGGGDIYILKEILGHRSVKVTETVYAHLGKKDLLELSKGVRW
jgi:integrase